MNKDNKKEQNEQCAIPSVSGSCFWGHKWTRWEQYPQSIRTRLGEGLENRQKREPYLF